MTSGAPRYHADGQQWGRQHVGNTIATFGVDQIHGPFSDAQRETIAAAFRDQLRAQCVRMVRFKTAPKLIESFVQGALEGFRDQCQEVAETTRPGHENGSQSG